MTPDELIAIACPQIRDLGWAYYFTPETMAVGQSVGLEDFDFYYAGRGGVLGNVEPSVVRNAFGYFNPTVIDQALTAAAKVVEPREAGRRHFECCAELGRERLGGLDDLEGFVAALEAVNDAADPTGLALYAAFKAEPLAPDLPARALQLVAVLRELRGSAHLVAIRVAGLDDRTAHHVTRPNDAAMFGWGPDDTPEVTDADRAAMARAEAITDDLVRPAYAVLDDDGQQALLAGLTALEKALAG